MTDPHLIDAIDALLPQTQCGKCSHPGCRPYAEAIARGEPINRCPPGGEATLRALAELLQRPLLSLAQPAQPAQLAFIREDECIGCTKCIQACPLDAILGAAKQMHTVLNDQCSGCELCLAPCPVDCIDLLPLAAAEAQLQRQRADQFRRRYNARNARLASLAEQRRATRALRPPVPAAAPPERPADAHLRQLKSTAAMSRAVLAKAERQLARHDTAELAAQVAQLRRAAETAAQALHEAQGSAPPGNRPTDLRQAKVAFALRRAELDKAQRQGADEPRLQALRTALQQAGEQLQAAEAACGNPPPQLQRSDRQPIDETLRQLKTERAYAHAELQRLTRRQARQTDSVSAEQLQAAQQRLHQAEQALHDAGP